MGMIVNRLPSSLSKSTDGWLHLRLKHDGYFIDKRFNTGGF